MEHDIRAGDILLVSDCLGDSLFEVASHPTNPNEPWYRYGKYIRAKCFLGTYLEIHKLTSQWIDVDKIISVISVGNKTWI